MKTRIALLSVIALVTVFAIPLQAHAYVYDFNDPIGDKIGNRPFELYGMNVTQTPDQIVFDIFSNYSENGYKVGTWYTKPGDFALDVNGDSIFEYGIAFRDHAAFGTYAPIVKGGVYQIDTSLNKLNDTKNGWYLSNHYAPSGYTYNKGKEVGIAGGTLIDTIDVTWNQNGTSPDWRVNFAIDKNDLSLKHGDIFNFFYSVATCSNDNMGGSITVTPEPASMALLGMGLAGLLAGKRKKFLNNRSK